MADTSTAAKATTAPGDQGQPESAPLAHEADLSKFTPEQRIHLLTVALLGSIDRSDRENSLRAAHALEAEALTALSAAPPAQPHPSQGAEGSRVIALLEKTHDVVFSVRNDAANDAADLYERQDYEPAKRLSATAIQLEPAVDALESVLALLRASQPPPEALKGQIERPCHLHDHFGSGECPDCGVRRKLAEAEARADAQAEALRAYAQHKAWCETRKCADFPSPCPLSPKNGGHRCNCGLDALLSASPAPHTERTT